jgi:S-DNA-T family DNA segregation ATPase FtsK/SpoIIIE
MSVVIVKRPPRVTPPTVPTGQVQIEPPPELARVAKDSNMLMNAGMPLMMGAGSIGTMFQTKLTAASVLSSGVMMVGAVGMGVMGLMRGRSSGKAKMADSRRDYLRYLAQLRRQVRRTGQRQRTAQLWSHPDPKNLWAIVATGQRLWERRPTDPDFTQVRLGSGVQNLATPLVPPETAPVDELEPICADALRRFIRIHGTLDDLPLAVSLRAFWHVFVSGRDDRARALARALLAQLTTFHSPDDLRVCLVTSEDRLKQWEWMKWLPHLQHPTLADAAGPVRLVTDDIGDLEQLLATDLQERPRFSRELTPVYDQPHIIVLVDGGRPSSDSLLLHGEGLQGVTVIQIDTTGGADPMRGGLVARVDDDGALSLQAGSGVGYSGKADELSLTQAEALGRQLAPLRLSTASGDEEPLLSNLEFTDLMGIGDPGQLDPGRSWRRMAPQERLRVPIGVGENGEPVILDLKEAAMGGMGPHGLCIGATGSGKSEVLRTLVLALLVSHSSESINFILSDFKGGATFAGMGNVPHVAAVITNLADDLTMVDRMRDAIIGETNRRQEMLRDAGNYKNIHDYERARAAGAAIEPMPNLIIILDEFSEMLTQKPEFIDVFLQIGRIGRSLGVHLLLASQRLEEGKLRGLDTYLSYRLGLKTFNAAESRTVLGVPDAFYLPSLPGSGYLKHDEVMVRFKAAYVSGPYRPASEQVERKLDHRRPTIFTAGYQAPPVVEEPTTPEPSAPAQEDDDALVDTVLDVICRRLEGQGPPAHQVWLPPLAEPPTLDQLLPGLRPTPDRGLSATEFGGVGRLVVPIATVDKPLEQKRDIMFADVSSAAGHAVIVGGPRTGKSTTVRTLISALALTHTPVEAQFFCLDFGGGTLATLSGLPHMGGVAGRLDVDMVRRIVSEVVSILDKREESFRSRNIDSIGTFRARRARGELPDEKFGDVFLVVDGWLTLRQEFELLEQDILDIAQRGLGFGVHLVLTAARWAELRPALKDAINTRIELRLGDPMESDIDRKIAANVPAGAPGRGLGYDKLHFLAALPRIDGVQDPADLAEGIEGMVKAIDTAWQGPHSPKVRMLPTLVPYEEMPAPGTGPGFGIPIGVDETKLEPVYLDFGVDPHLLIFGESESGKTAVLRNVIKGITNRYTLDQARIIVADYRRTLLDEVPEPYRLGYAAAAPAFTTMVRDIKASLDNRLPGPDVTPEQLRNRSWWKGPEVFVIVDDYDLVATSGNPVAQLVELLPLAKDVGLHLIIARSSGGAGRALFEPVIQRLRELRMPGLLLSGDREEGQLIGNVRPSQQPPGRGTLITRRHGQILIQTAFAPSKN